MRTTGNTPAATEVRAAVHADDLNPRDAPREVLRRRQPKGKEHDPDENESA
jgi:hypothetical protein